MKTKSQPMRTCVGCGEPKSKRELMRVALRPRRDNQYRQTGKAPGRGAYICASMDCFEAAYKGKKLERSLKHAVSKEVYEALKHDLEGHE